MFLEELMKGEEISWFHKDVKWMQSLQEFFCVFFKWLTSSYSPNSTFRGGNILHTENWSQLENFNMCILPVVRFRSTQSYYSKSVSDHLIFCFSSFLLLPLQSQPNGHTPSSLFAVFLPLLSTVCTPNGVLWLTSPGTVSILLNETLVAVSANSSTSILQPL